MRNRGNETVFLSIGNSSQDITIATNYSAVRLADGFIKIRTLDFDYVNRDLYISLESYGTLEIMQLSGEKVVLTYTDNATVPSDNVYSIPINKVVTESDLAPSSEVQIVNNIIYYERSGNVVTVTFNGFQIDSLAENAGYSGLTFPTCAGAHGTYFSLMDYTSKENVPLRIQGNVLRGGVGGVTNKRVWGTVTYITTD